MLAGLWLQLNGVSGSFGKTDDLSHANADVWCNIVKVVFELDFTNLRLTLKSLTKTL
jgi:hypothetical protein